jgi:hypothetical protein
MEILKHEDEYYNTWDGWYSHISLDLDEYYSTWDGWYSHISLDLDEYINYYTSIICG